MNQKNLMPAIKSGKVSVATIDEKIRHILTTAERFGWLDPDHHQTDLAFSPTASRTMLSRSMPRARASCC